MSIQVLEYSQRRRATSLSAFIRVSEPATYCFANSCHAVISSQADIKLYSRRLSILSLNTWNTSLAIELTAPVAPLAPEVTPSARPSAKPAPESIPRSLAISSIPVLPSVLPVNISSKPSTTLVAALSPLVMVSVIPSFVILAVSIPRSLAVLSTASFTSLSPESRPSENIVAREEPPPPAAAKGRTIPVRIASSTPEDKFALAKIATFEFR